MSSWWLPSSYLRLRTFDKTERRGNEIEHEILQGIVYRLFALASASREHMMFGEPQQNLGIMDKILALGLQDSTLPNVIPQNSQNNQVTSTGTGEYERYIMAPFLRKIYELLKAAQGLKFIDRKPCE
jgi:hypothetical protein